MIHSIFFKYDDDDDDSGNDDDDDDEMMMMMMVIRTIIITVTITITFIVAAYTGSSWFLQSLDYLHYWILGTAATCNDRLRSCNFAKVSILGSGKR